MGIKKSKGVSGHIAKTTPPDPNISFSFQFFDDTDDEVCPATFRDGYTQALMTRLKGLSTWRVREFTAGNRVGVRNHGIDWPTTSRPDGFSQLPAHYSDVKAWQFSVTANEHGRVQGFFIDSTFYVVWLDHNHMVYPGAD